MIHPGHDRVLIAPRQRGREFRRPHIVALRLHVNLVIRIGRSLHTPAQHHSNLVMPIRETMSFDSDSLSRNAFGGEASAVEVRQNSVNDGAHPPFGDCSSTVRYRRQRLGLFGRHFSLGTSHEPPSPG